MDARSGLERSSGPSKHSRPTAGADSQAMDEIAPVRCPLGMVDMRAQAGRASDQLAALKPAGHARRGKPGRAARRGADRSEHGQVAAGDRGGDGGGGEMDCETS